MRIVLKALVGGEIFDICFEEKMTNIKMINDTSTQFVDTDISPTIILCRPQLGENIGTAARAMLNCRVSDLRIVKPRDGWPNPKALNACSGADEIIANAGVFDSLVDALGDLDLVFATTARTREVMKRVIDPRTAADEVRIATKSGRRIGLLFGPERTGLDNEEIELADSIIAIPLNPNFTSLNLAQAVLILCYEWYTNRSHVALETEGIDSREPIDKRQLASFFDFLETALDERGFYPTPEMKPRMIRNMRAMFLRTGLTRQDVQTLYGMVKKLTRGKC